MRVPGKVLVEHYSKVPHHGAVTDRVLAKPNGDWVQATAICENGTRQGCARLMNPRQHDSSCQPLVMDPSSQ